MRLRAQLAKLCLLLILAATLRWDQALSKPLGSSQLNRQKNSKTAEEQTRGERRNLLRKNRRDAVEIWPLSQSRHLMPLGRVWTEAFDQLSQVCFSRTEDVTMQACCLGSRAVSPSPNVPPMTLSCDTPARRAKWSDSHGPGRRCRRPCQGFSSTMDRSSTAEVLSRWRPSLSGNLS